MKKLLLILFVLLPMMLSAHELKPRKHSKKELWGYWGEEARYNPFSGDYTAGFAIRPKFEAVYPFERSRDNYRWYAFVKEKGLWGVINTNGKFVVEPKYTSVGKSNPYGIRFVGLNGKFGLAEGVAELTAICYDGIKHSTEGHYFFAQSNGKYSVLDGQSGKVLCDIKCDNIEVYYYSERDYDESETTFIAKLNGKCGLFNRYGREIVPLQYDRIIKKLDFYDNPVYLVKSNGKYGLVNKGREILPVQYDSIEKLDSHYYRVYLVKSNGKCGLFDRYECKVIIPAQYDSIEKLDSRYYRVYLVKSNGKCGLLDRDECKVIIPAQYDDIRKYDDERFIVKLDDKYGLLDYNGIIIAKPQYKRFESIGDKLIALYDDQWTFVNLSGRSIGVIHYTTNDGRPVHYTGRAKSVFCDGKGALVFDGTLTAIEDGTFSGCENLTDITIPDSVTEIGENAFSGSGVIVENGVKYIGDYLVGVVDKTQETYTIRKGTRVILNCAFADCKFLEKITIPNGVVTISARAFKGCCNLQNITIPSSVTSVGTCAFDDCIALASVHISDLSAWCKIKFEDSETSSPFHYASDLYLNGKLVTKLTIPSEITEIKPHTFYGCNSLTSITIPNSVTEIGDSAFKGCSQLTNMVIGNGVTSIGRQAFYGCTGKLILNCNVSSASEYQESAFYGSNFTDITIGDSVISIGKLAFYHTGVRDYEYGWRGTLKSLTIGKSVTLIEENAFANWYTLESVYCKAALPPKSPNGMFKGRNVYVPRKSVNIYKTDPNWRDCNIIGYDF